MDVSHPILQSADSVLDVPPQKKAKVQSTKAREEVDPTPQKKVSGTGKFNFSSW